MPSLSEQLQALQELKAEFNEALNTAKALQKAQIDEKVQIVINEALPKVSKSIKRELNDDLSAVLAIKNEAFKVDLKKDLQSTIEQKFSTALDEAEFLEKLDKKAFAAVENKVEEKLSNFEMLNLQFKNATSCFKLCLHNELFVLSEALKTIAQIEFYEQKLRENSVINKAYQIR